MRTGWNKKFKDHRAYCGYDLGMPDKKEHFPGFGIDACKILLERGVGALGIDTGSIDVGNSEDLPVHTTFLRTDRYQIENMVLDQLPNKGFTFISLPLKVKGGPESETRVMAIIPE